LGVPSYYHGNGGSLKILIIQTDGKWMNLALAKLFKYHKNKGDEVTFIDLSGYKADRIYGSKIFTGGSGCQIKSELPNDIECLAPDYEEFKNSCGERIGFTSRGCIRNCGFCIVQEKEGSIRNVDWSWAYKSSKVILLDNNFLASSEWKEKLNYFIKMNIQVCFSQGLDIRLINSENASLLSKVKYRNHTFRGKTLYFALDHPELIPIIEGKVRILNEAGIDSRYMIFYVLVGFNTTFEEDLERVYFLIGLGVRPYIMIYNNRQNNQKILDLARWVNGMYYKKVSRFEDYIPVRKQVAGSFGSKSKV
jgi:hypothetical protein